MTIGFFLALINFGSSWSGTIVSSFRELAGHAGGTATLDPSGILDQGIYVAVLLITKMVGILQPVDSVLAGFIGLFIIVCYALIAAELIFVLVSMWVILYAGIIVLALGGSEWTRSYAVNYYKIIFALGMKMFVLQLLIAIGGTIISNWAGVLSDDPTFQEVFVIAGGVVVLYTLVKGVSGLVDGLVSGSGAAGSSGSSAITAAVVGAGGAVAGAAVVGAGMAQSAMGMGQAVSAASSLASMSNAVNGPSGLAQSITSLGGAVGGETGREMGQSLGGAFDSVAGTVKEATSAYGQDYSARASGDASAQYGTSGGRMANIMNDKIAESEIGSVNPGEAGNYVSGVDSGAAEENLAKKDE